MARGDVRWFNRALHDLGSAVHNLNTAALRIGIVTATTAPTIDTADPRWGAGGATNFSSSQVALGTGYTGPVALANVTWSQVANVPTLRGNVVTVPQDTGAGFTNGAYGIIYNDTDAGKRAIGFVDFGGSVGNVNGPLDIDWSGATDDILRLPATA